MNAVRRAHCLGDSFRTETPLALSLSKGEQAVRPSPRCPSMLRLAALKGSTPLALSLSKGEQAVRPSLRCPSILRQAQDERAIGHPSTFARLCKRLFIAGAATRHQRLKANGLCSVVGALECGDVYLAHLEHGLQGALGACGIRPANEPGEGRGDDLPGVSLRPACRRVNTLFHRVGA